MDTNKTTANCSKPTAKDEIAVLQLYSIFASISVLVYLTAIGIIVKGRAYRLFLHRLTLYLAIGGILHSLACMLQVLPVEVNPQDGRTVELRKGWGGACVFGGFMIQYAGFVQAFTVSWICCYLFGLVVFQKQWKQLKHEIAGVSVIAFAPFLFTWEPFITDSYGLLGTRCWIKDRDCRDQYDLMFAYAMAVNVVPNFLLLVLDLSLLGGAITFLTRKAFAKVLKSQHWLAVREILPLTIYPVAYMLVVSGRLLALVAGKYTNDVGHAFMALNQLCSLALPVSLLLRSSVRSRLCSRKKEEPMPLATTTYEKKGDSETLKLI